MKKIVFVLGLLLVMTSVQAFKVNNQTGQSISVQVMYPGWWFNHTYIVGAFNNNFEMADRMDPHLNATYVISTTDGFHQWYINCSTMANFTLRFENTYSNIRLYIGSISVV